MQPLRFGKPKVTIRISEIFMDGTPKQPYCKPQSPICMTIGFMFGTIVGSMIHTEHSFINVVTSVIAASVVFHLVFVKNINITPLFSKVIKKGS